MATVTMDYDSRTKARLRVKLDNGVEAGIFIDRGKVLKQGDLLSSEQGDIVRVKAAPESVSTVRAGSEKDLLTACYHLGNRHISLEIGSGWLRYLQDHVLDEMVRYLGLSVTHEIKPFTPQSGAYQAASHHHETGHVHAH